LAAIWDGTNSSSVGALEVPIYEGLVTRSWVIGPIRWAALPANWTNSLVALLAVRIAETGIVLLVTTIGGNDTDSSTVRLLPAEFVAGGGKQFDFLVKLCLRDLSRDTRAENQKS